MSWFSFFKKKPKALTPVTLVAALKGLGEEMDDLIYAFTLLDYEYRLPTPYREQAIDFANKANFGVSSFHDTLKLGYEALRWESAMEKGKSIERSRIKAQGQGSAEGSGLLHAQAGNPESQPPA